MSGLNYLCLNDVSDDDCYKCMKHGIIFRCPNPCPDFDDAREQMSPREKAARKLLMELLGMKDFDDPEDDADD